MIVTTHRFCADIITQRMEEEKGKRAVAQSKGAVEVEAVFQSLPTIALREGGCSDPQFSTNNYVTLGERENQTGR